MMEEGRGAGVWGEQKQQKAKDFLSKENTARENMRTNVSINFIFFSLFEPAMDANSNLDSLSHLGFL